MQKTFNHRLLLLIFIGMWTLSCASSTPSPTATPRPTAQPSITPTATPSHTPTPFPTSTPASLLDLSALWNSDETTLFEQAMRPAFVADVSRLPQATRYRLDLRVAPDLLTLTGTAHISYTNQEKEPLNEIVVRLLPNLPAFGASMTLDAVLVDGHPVTPTMQYQNSAAYLPLRTPLQPGERIALTLTYQSTLPDHADAGYAQYGYFDGVLALPGAYPLIPVYDDEGWNVELAPSYGDVTFSDTAFYLVRLTLPDKLTVITSGVIITGTLNSDATQTLLAVSGPMRDFNIVAGYDYQILVEHVDDVRVAAYYRVGDQTGGRLALDYATYALRYYERILGPYPFNEFDVVATPTTAGGIEYPGLIVIARHLYNQTGGFFEMAVVHETAHQWWYSLVGNDQLDEPWLDESLTQYTTLLYFEERYGHETAQQILQSFETWYKSLPADWQEMSIGLPVAAYSEYTYGPIVYGKGPLFFHELRQKIGDKAFFRLLPSYFERYRYGIAYPADLIDLAEQVSGQKLTPWYRQWVK